MLSILVAHSYFLEFDQKQRQRAKPYPPLATLQVAAILRDGGHEVSLFDAMLATGVGDYQHRLSSRSPQVVVLYEDNFNFLSKMCLGRMRDAACQMISLARKHAARVIVAGSDASDAPHTYLAAGADAVLIGEGIATLRALIDRLNNSPNLGSEELCEGLMGVVAARKDSTARIGARVSAPEPEHPSAAAWDLVDIERYRDVWTRAHGYFSLNMAASRGCSFRCNWCAKPIWGSRYLQRTPVEVAEEMAFLRRSFAPDHIWFADDIFGFRTDWVESFAKAVHERGGPIPFTIQTRTDLLSEGMTHALREAGCREAWIGVESGSQRIVDAMNKGIDVADVPVARDRLANVGIRVGFFIQLGYLGEELEDILATRALIEKARPDEIGVSVAYPLPGTKFYELVKAQLQAKTHWRESNDLEMMFEGTYTSDFYRAVRDLLHSQVDVEKARTGRSQAEYRAARRALEQRWAELLDRESECRTDAPSESSAVLVGG